MPWKREISTKGLFQIRAGLNQVKWFLKCSRGCNASNVVKYAVYSYGTIEAYFLRNYRLLFPQFTDVNREYLPIQYYRGYAHVILAEKYYGQYRNRNAQIGNCNAMLYQVP